jgi:hypothetical protein
MKNVMRENLSRSIEPHTQYRHIAAMQLLPRPQPVREVLETAAVSELGQWQQLSTACVQSFELALLRESFIEHFPTVVGSNESLTGFA